MNPNTLQRAFGELERDELVRVERAAGRFVTDDQDKIAAVRQRLATTAADEYISQSKGFGMSSQEASALIKRRWTDDNPDHDHSQGKE